MSNTVLFGAWAMAAGAGIPIMASLNGALSKSLGGSPAAAAFVLFVVALMAATAFIIASGATSDLSRLTSTPPHLMAGGLFVAFYVLSVTTLVPRFGVANTILFVMMAQITVSSLIDAFGLFGSVVRPLDAQRVVGLVVMAIGLTLTQFSAKAPGG